MILGPNTTHCDIICSHIWLASSRGVGLTDFLLRIEDINNPENFLRLHSSIEKAFDRKKLYFSINDEGNGAFRLVVNILDPLLRDPTQNGSFFNVNNRHYLFGDLDGRHSDYLFTPNQKPYLRLIAQHALKAIDKARALGWIRDLDNLANRRADCSPVT
jgi:hypothetical protein